MQEQPDTWDKPSIELPPGWHRVVHKLADLTGVSMKYVYTLALDRLLSEPDFGVLADAVWAMRRDAQTDLAQVGASHTIEEVEERYRRAQDKKRSPARKSATAPRKRRKQ